MVLSSDNLNANKQGWSEGGEISGYRWHGGKSCGGVIPQAPVRQLQVAAALVLLGECPSVCCQALMGSFLLRLSCETALLGLGDRQKPVTILIQRMQGRGPVRFLSEEKIPVNGGEGVGVKHRISTFLPVSLRSTRYRYYDQRE